MFGLPKKVFVLRIIFLLMPKSVIMQGYWKTFVKELFRKVMSFHTASLMEAFIEIWQA